jgi:hypothetical protein
LVEIETDVLKEFDTSLSADEKETLRLSRQFRNKVLHSDFRAAREKLEKLGIQIESAGTKKIELPQPTKRFEKELSGQRRRDLLARLSC